MGGLWPSARPCRDVSRRAKTNKRPLPTSRRPLLRGCGLKIKRPQRNFLALTDLKSWCLFNRLARLANISGKEAVEAFEKAGWRVIGQVGSHVVMTKPDGARIFPFLNIKSFRQGRFALSFGIQE